MLKLPIGYDNFARIVEDKFDFVDKSLLIKDILDELSQVVLILRPRRFGKTLNLSMLHCFFASDVYGKSTHGLFAGLKIMQTGKHYLQHQGKYPVIFITFKDIKSSSFADSRAKLRELLKRTFNQHAYLSTSQRLTQAQLNAFNSIYLGTADSAQFSNGLLTLSECLAIHHGISPWLLIDEYDSPLQSAYVHGYYQEMTELMRDIFSVALKTNPYLHRAVITGILRIAKEDLFSGLNNLGVYSVLDKLYSEYFGFTEVEVESIIEQANLTSEADNIRRWFNGYQFGNTVIYNPWSIVHLVHKEGQIKPYWVNTSDNALIKKLLTHGTEQFKADFELLIVGQTVTKPIDENMVFGDLIKNEHAAWSLLLMAGYLKAISQAFIRGKTYCELKIPNLEVSYLYENIVIEWLANGHGIGWYNHFLDYLLSGKIDLFAKALREIMLEIVSSHDTGKQGENFYHGLMLGFTASLHHDPDYELSSNKESGYGRYDYLILSKKANRPTLLLEFKKVDAPKDIHQLEAKLHDEASTALQQMKTNRYATHVKQRGFTDIIYVATAFCGRELAIVFETT